MEDSCATLNVLPHSQAMEQSPKYLGNDIHIHDGTFTRNFKELESDRTHDSEVRMRAEPKLSADIKRPCKNATVEEEVDTTPIPRATHKIQEHKRLAERMAATKAKFGERDDPWAGLAILSLDGGGISGYYSLLILQSLMEYIDRLESSNRSGTTESLSLATTVTLQETKNVGNREGAHGHRLHQYFDLIGGTSTGGLIAIMLGRLRMTVGETLARYRKLVDQQFIPKPSIWHILWLPLKPKDSNTAVERLFRDMLAVQSSADEDAAVFRSDPSRCKTVLCSMSLNKSKVTKPYLFRSYPMQPYKDKDQNRYIRNPGPASSASILEVARATSAAPVYFSSKPVHLQGHSYIDAGPFVNNPSWEIYKECKALRYNNSTDIDIFISVGCKPVGNLQTKDVRPASPPNSSLGNKFKSTLSTMQTLSDLVDDTMKSLSSDTWYWRLTEDIEIGKAQSMDSIEKDFSQWFLSEGNKRTKLEECASILVDIRKRREKTSLWERFAEGTRYQCPLCTGHSRCFRTRVDLKDHLQVDHHKISDVKHHEEMQSLLNKGRRPKR